MLHEIYKINSYAKILVAIDEYSEMNSSSIYLGYLMELIEEKAHQLSIQMDVYRVQE